MTPSTYVTQYLLIFYHYDSKYIHAEGIPNRQKESHVTAYKRAHAIFTKRGLKPKLLKLDNECSELLEEFLEKEEVKYQLTTAYQHRQNTAERAIRTFKIHFIPPPCNFLEPILEVCLLLR